MDVDDKRARLRTVLKELQQQCREEKVGQQQQQKRGGGVRSVVRYHGPYIDLSGERFFLPCKWRKQLGDDNKNCWKECNINYSFDKDEMNGTRLIQNLKWLGKSNELIDLFGGGGKSSPPLWRQRTGGSSSMCGEVDDDDDNDEEERLMGRGSFGGSSSGMMQWQWRSNDAAIAMFGERELRRALPEMNNTLSNWTLHGQNLGNMMRNYRQQYRHLRADQWRELGHFFNTASNVLDTLGSMTENAILRCTMMMTTTVVE